MHNPSALGLVFVNGASHVYAVDCATGVSPSPPLIWAWTVPAADGGTSSAFESGGVLYVGADDFNVYALDAHTGQALWRAPTKGMWKRAQTRCSCCVNFANV